MSKFNVHEWNHKRRLAEIEDNTEEMRSEAVTNLIDAIEIAKNYNLFNTAQELILDQITASLIKKMAGERGDIKENLSEVNLSKALPTIAARNVERNNNINFDIESMMDMVGDAGKDQNSEEAQILFRASNASEALERALTELQMYFEDDLG